MIDYKGGYYTLSDLIDDLFDIQKTCIKNYFFYSDDMQKINSLLDELVRELFKVQRKRIVENK